MKRKFWALFALSLILLFSLPVLYLIAQNDAYYGHFLNRPASDFVLKDVDDNPHGLQDHRGRYVFLYFGYIHCDEVCHNQVGVMFNLDRQGGNKDVDFLFITMDPFRDSAETLKQYFNQFGDNFIALRSESVKQVQKLASRYHASFYPEGDWLSNKDYEINHPGNLYLIDTKGVVKLMYPNMHLRYDYILQDLQKLKLTQKTENNGDRP